MNQLPCQYCNALISEEYCSCKAIFEAALAKEYSDLSFGSVHLLTVDAYALQHSEEHGPRSNAFHLMHLCLLLEHNHNPAIGQGPQRSVAKAFEKHYRNYPFLNPPDSRGDINIAYVNGANSPEEYALKVNNWAKSVWQAWEAHHLWARNAANEFVQN